MPAGTPGAGGRPRCATRTRTRPSRRATTPSGGTLVAIERGESVPGAPPVDLEVEGGSAAVPCRPRMSGRPIEEITLPAAVRG